MKNISSPEEISAIFAKSHDNFPVIISRTSNNDVQRLRRYNLQALQDIYLGDGTNATVIILYEVDHKAANAKQVFNCADGALKAYDPCIRYDYNSAVHLLHEKNCSRKLD